MFISDSYEGSSQQRSELMRAKQNIVQIIDDCDISEISISRHLQDPMMCIGKS